MHFACKHASLRCLITRKTSSQALTTSARRTSATPSRKRTAVPPRRIIFSGIQPTGVPHLGNYLGALRQWKSLQDEPDQGRKRSPQCFFSVVDLHALTVPQSPQLLQQWKRESFASLMAIGLTSAKSTLFHQSDVPGHPELHWLLSTIASTGYLSRMTQWKSKLGLDDDASLDQESARAKLKLGLFSYPVLQAADILLYGTTHVPIGADQTQHVEFARRLASSFNHLYPLHQPPPSNNTQPPTPIFTLPQPLISPAARIMSLRDPTQKMSKSHPDPTSRILITDTREEITDKIRSALTDSVPGTITYDPSKRPGVSNLFEILYHTTTDPTLRQATDPAHLASRPEIFELSMKSFKSLVADSVITCFADIGIRFEYLMQTKEGQQQMDDAREAGTRRAKAKAGDRMSKVRLAVGLDSW